MMKSHGPDFLAYLVCSLVGIVFFSLGLSTYVAEGNLKAPLPGFAFLLFSIYSVSRFKLTLTAEGIEYTTLFRRTRKLRWSNVDRVETGVDRQRSGSPYFTRLYSKDPAQTFDIPIKFFSRKALIHLVHSLQNHSPQAQLDDATLRMGEGIMPSMYD